MDFSEIFTNIEHYLIVLLVSAVPIIELKGAIPIGLGLGLGLWETFFTALLGSCLPAPFLILLIRSILKWMNGSKISFFHKVADFLNRKIQKGQQSKAFRTSAILGLFVFVAIPLPTTGVWTGSMIAGVLDLRLKSALPVIVLGNTIAGLIILSMSHLLIF